MADIHEYSQVWIEIVMNEMGKNQTFHFDLQIHPTLLNSTSLHCQMTGFLPLYHFTMHLAPVYNSTVFFQLKIVKEPDQKMVKNTISKSHYTRTATEMDGTLHTDFDTSFYS